MSHSGVRETEKQNHHLFPDDYGWPDDDHQLQDDDGHQLHACEQPHGCDESKNHLHVHHDDDVESSDAPIPSKTTAKA